jgi:FkbM family methyltransferase
MPSGDKPESLTFSLALMQNGFYGQAQESVRQGDVVVDVGAHAGVFTRRALSQGASRVIAFEALPIACEALRRTFASEISTGRVVVVNAALWDSRVKLPLLIDRQDSMRTSLVLRGPGAIETQWVLTDTLDSQLQALGQGEVDFIKVHVEGAENRVLRGASQTIKRMHPRIAVPAFHTPDDVEDISLTLKAASADYQFRHSRCIVEYSRIRPEMLFAGF